MAAKSNLLNMSLSLTLTCLLCSAVLGAAYALTKEPIDAAQQEKLDRGIAMVTPPFDSTEEQSVDLDGKTYKYYEAISGGETVGYAIEVTENGFGGPLTLMVGITADGQVYNTSVLSHSETPGLGAKCADESPFRAQFRGLNPSEKILSVKKDGGDIDAITASTITSRAYTLAVSSAVAVYKLLTTYDEGTEE